MSTPVFLDNTVLTNFAKAGRADLVLEIWGEQASTTSAVMREYQAGVKSESLPATGRLDELIAS